MTSKLYLEVHNCRKSFMEVFKQSCLTVILSVSAKMSKTLKVLQISLCITYIVVISQFFNAVINKYDEIVQLNYITPTPGLIKKMHRELKMHLSKQSNGTVQIHTSDYKKPNRLATDLKFILKFSTAYSHFGNPAFRDGQDSFIERKCKYINCVFTNNMNLLIDIRNFDAVLLDVEHEWEGHPLFRSPQQKYIFSATESADYYPICSPFFDNYYNLTWTYKLDSDIPWTSFTIRNKSGHKVGPKLDMKWINPMNSTSEAVKKKLTRKSKAAAWFVSNCRSKSPRLKIAEKIQNELQMYGHRVDIYGYCGNLTCPKESHADCLEILQEHYYFYFVFENSISEDYVTEKLLYAVNHYTVPVVYGGSNYSRYCFKVIE